MQDTNTPQPMDSLIGKLLVASTTVQDPVLSRAVCLVVHQDSENVFAVLLNRPMTPPPGLAKLLCGSRKPGKLPGNSVDGSSRIRRADKFNDNPFPYPSNLPGADLPGTGASSKNRMVPSDVGEPKESLAEQTAAETSQSLGTIHFGGPLSGPIVAVHSSSEHAEAEAGRGVYVAAQREVLETLMKHKPGSFRLIVGHLGWSHDQLRSERESGFWHIIEATDEDVFVGDQELWPSVIRRATTASVAHWLGISDTPVDAEVN